MRRLLLLLLLGVLLCLSSLCSLHLSHLLDLDHVLGREVGHLCLLEGGICLHLGELLRAHTRMAVHAHAHTHTVHLLLLLSLLLLLLLLLLLSLLRCHHLPLTSYVLLLLHHQLRIAGHCLLHLLVMLLHHVGLRVEMAHGHGVRTGTAHGLLGHHTTTRARTHTGRHILLAGLHAHHGRLTHVRSARTRDSRHLHRLAHVLGVRRHSRMAMGYALLHARRVGRKGHALHHNGQDAASGRVESSDKDDGWSNRRRATMDSD